MAVRFLRELKTKKNNDEAVYFIYAELDRWYKKGEIYKTDQVLSILANDTEFILDNVLIVIGLLTITIPLKNELKYREQFYDRVFHLYCENLGDEETHELLNDLQ